MSGENQINISTLKKGSHIHLMGICGTAMASLAGLLKDLGYHITGSELRPYPPMSTQIAQMGIEIKKPYSAKNLHPHPDFVIVGNVISANNEEAQELLRLGIAYTSLPKAMGDMIIGQRKSVVIAGTHGKTTTTALSAWVCTELGLSPGFLIGGIGRNFSKSFQLPHGNYFLIEGDEYDTAFFDKVPKFIHYKPSHVILTSIEFDHADIYSSLDEVREAFFQLMKLIPPEGSLIYHGNDSDVLAAAALAPTQNKYSYGIDRGEETSIQFASKILSVDEEGTTFRVTFRESTSTLVKEVGQFHVSLGGEYNILNCTSVIALAYTQNWNMPQVAKALSTFLGVKRRQEVLGEPKGVLVVEDFAHHPTAVWETLKGLKERYHGRRLLAVFEPRSATSRRRIFQKDYIDAFNFADDVIIMKAFDQTKMNENDRFSSEELAKDILNRGKSALAFNNVDEIVQNLSSRVRRGDIIAIMSNGGFEGIYEKLIHSIESLT